MHSRSLYSLLIVCCLLTHSVYAEVSNEHRYRSYVGVTTGYGYTTWQGLVPPSNKQNLAMTMSTPNNVSEGGVLYGFFVGYEFVPQFALEAAYMHYPDARVSFHEDSIFTFDYGFRHFVSKTESVSLMGKIMLTIPKVDLRAYSSLGVAAVHRNDVISDHWIASPTFGAGFNYNITPHIMAELGAVYTAGKGVSELNPAEDYFPFIYSVFLRLAYRF